MKYSVGQKVKIRSLEWYRDNVNRYGIIECGKYEFFEPMNEYCGKVVTIKRIDDDNYRIDVDKGAFCWTDEMIEGLVEEETKPKFKVGDEVRIKGTDIGGTIESVIRGQLIVNSKGSKIPAWPEDVVLMKSVEEETEPNIIEEAKTYWDSIKDAWICPEGYHFKDENGNIINATKIVLEKKKKEYPKTYLECCDILEIQDIISQGVNGYLRDKLETLQKLLICRDAYWKIAGEEMGLGKPWEPSGNEDCFVVSRSCGEVYLYSSAGDCEPFEFPTAKMQDAFYENFKKEIEMCKELL